MSSVIMSGVMIASYMENQRCNVITYHISFDIFSNKRLIFKTHEYFVMI